jgi:hypothetical protein
VQDVAVRSHIDEPREGVDALAAVGDAPHEVEHGQPAGGQVAVQVGRVLDERHPGAGEHVDDMALDLPGGEQVERGLDGERP